MVCRGSRHCDPNGGEKTYDKISTAPREREERPSTRWEKQANLEKTTPNQENISMNIATQ